jgi:hypothetical protein
MNADKEKTVLDLTRRNPFWICLAVFLALACDQGFRLAGQLEQRKQLSEAQLMQAQNIGALNDAAQLENRLQLVSLELLQVARTNALARQIVQDFNIQWNPGPAAPAIAPAAAATPVPITPPPTNPRK